MEEKGQSCQLTTISITVAQERELGGGGSSPQGEGEWENKSSWRGEKECAGLKERGKVQLKEDKRLGEGVYYQGEGEGATQGG